MAFDGTYLYYTLWFPPDMRTNIYKITTAGQHVATIPVEGGVTHGGPLTWDGGALWTMDYAANSFVLYRVDAATGAILSSCNLKTMNPSHLAITSFPNVGTYPDGLHWSGSTLWISSEAGYSWTTWVVEADTSCRILRAFNPPDYLGIHIGTSGVAYVGDSLWHASPVHPQPNIFQTDLSGVPTGLSFAADPPMGELEDLEFDPITFAPKCALWANEATGGPPNHIRAYEIPCPAVQPLVANAGGPYTGSEGEPVQFDASGSTGTDLEYRWDFDGDGTWDTNFSPSPIASHVFGDDFVGFARVEAKAIGEGAQLEIGGALQAHTTVAGTVLAAQSFVATFDIISQVTADVSRNRDDIPGTPLSLSIRSSLDGADLAVWSVPGGVMPVGRVENWVVFDVPDLSVVRLATYYVVFRSEAPDVPYELHASLDAYSEGTQYNKASAGTWIADPTLDLRMVVSGPLTISTSVDESPVTVHNVPPLVVGTISSSASADLRLRVAGEKWHNVQILLIKGGVEVAAASVTRVPGSPDDHEVKVTVVPVNFLEDYSARVHYTPLDDSNNGQLWGDNPAWLKLTFEDGREVRLRHNFNVRHPGTWTWDIPSFRPYLVGAPITFMATGSDVGSDDLTFAWGFGDGSTATRTVYNNGVSPDPFPSPDVNPITATDEVAHAFAAAGDYVVTLTVMDDDTGTASCTLTFSLG